MSFVSHYLSRKFTPSPFDNYFRVLGPEKCKLLAYRKDRVVAEYSKRVSLQNVDSSNLEKLIYSSFSIGVGYSSSKIKERLCEIYNQIGYKKTAAASDIQDFFNVVRCNILGESGKMQRGFKLISKKE